ncbi:MAG: hypothetical protein F6K56_44940 [Moorea sp. SIO3G5]|nr:hypothetical protein [Moorena sp. SIO3G5]
MYPIGLVPVGFGLVRSRSVTYGQSRSVTYGQSRSVALWANRIPLTIYM